jgi:hypothetical protein
MSRSLRDSYGALFLDCPAGISLLTENVLRAADVVIVPLVPSPLSVRMLRELHAFVAAEGWSDLVLLPFFSMVDRRRSLHQELVASLRAEFPGMLTTEVSYRADIERMAVRRMPLAAGGSTSAAAQTYTQLWLEIVQRTAAAAGPAPAVTEGPTTLAESARDQVPRHIGTASKSAAPSRCRTAGTCGLISRMCGCVSNCADGAIAALRGRFSQLPCSNPGLHHLRSGYVDCVGDQRRRRRPAKGAEVTVR